LYRFCTGAILPDGGNNYRVRREWVLGGQPMSRSKSDDFFSRWKHFLLEAAIFILFSVTQQHERFSVLVVLGGIGRRNNIATATTSSCFQLLLLAGRGAVGF